ncbi:MAG: SBBP repeat-containing protein [Planctomycetes bacterium]|nr:SBBP repeat-containing protein [Planctomycetota bacterium]
MAALTLGVALLSDAGQAQTVEWARSAGGVADDRGSDAAVDDVGNSYVTGSFQDTATFGLFTLTSVVVEDPRDIFVAKFDADGNVLWARSAGGTGSDVGEGIAIDADGNSYVTGFYESTATYGPFALTSAGARDIFVAKYDGSGNVLWATSAGGTSIDIGNSIAVDAAGNSYVTGDFFGTATFGPFTLTSLGSFDIFVVKYDTNGTVVWAQSAGGTGIFDMGKGIAVDSAGNGYVTGRFENTATFGPFTVTSDGDGDIFLAKYDTDGNVIWVRSAGGTLNDMGDGIGIDAVGNIYVTGLIRSTAAMFDLFTLTGDADYDLFLVKYDTNGTVLLAQSARIDPRFLTVTMAVDPAGNSYIAGNSEGTATFGPFSVGSVGGGDIFVAKYDSAGGVLWAQSAGGSSLDVGTGIGVDGVGNSYVTGFFGVFGGGTATFDPFTITSAGSGDVFVAKYNNCGSGSIDPGEDCDRGLGCTDCLCDMDFEPTDPPSLDCRPICGNGSVDPGEECDGGLGCTDCLCDATSVPTAPPSLDCQPFCGNGVCDPGEDSCNCPNDCGTPAESEIPGSTCTDGLDNDCDGEADCRDPDCEDDPDCEGVPTVSQWGMALLLVALLAGIALKFRRSRTT